MKQNCIVIGERGFFQKEWECTGEPRKRVKDWSALKSRVEEIQGGAGLPNPGKRRAVLRSFNPASCAGSKGARERVIESGTPFPSCHYREGTMWHD